MINFSIRLIIWGKKQKQKPTKSLKKKKKIKKKLLFIEKLYEIRLCKFNHDDPKTVRSFVRQNIYLVWNI